MSAPAGMGAPVMMRRAWPGRSVPAKTDPAASSATTSSARVPVAGDVGRRDGIAVDGRVVRGRHVHLGADIVGEDAAERRGQGQELGRGRGGDAIQDVRLGVPHRDHGGIIAWAQRRVLPPLVLRYRRHDGDVWALRVAGRRRALLRAMRRRPGRGPRRAACVVSAAAAATRPRRASRPSPPRPRPAGFWIRFVAVLIDGVVLLVAQGILFGAGWILWGGGMGAGMAVRGRDAASSARSSARGTASSFTGMWGQTLGKMALQIRVVSMDGGPLSFGQVGRPLFRHLPVGPHPRDRLHHGRRPLRQAGAARSAGRHPGRTPLAALAPGSRPCRCRCRSGTAWPG